jgi:hypothetical protein
MLFATLKEVPQFPHLSNSCHHISNLLTLLFHLPVDTADDRLLKVRNMTHL